MRVEIDVRALKREMDSEEFKREVTREWAGRWHSRMQDLLLQRGEELGYEVHTVVQAISPPEWRETEMGPAWVISQNHVVSEIFEYGSEPHPITPTNADFLLFPWPNAPEEVKEEWRPTWEDPQHFLEEPFVLYPEVDHPGTEEIRHTRDSREMVRTEMANSGGES